MNNQLEPYEAAILTALRISNDKAQSEAKKTLDQLNVALAIIGPRYGLAEGDYIDDNGTITRKEKEVN